ncbi:flagellar biosynthesis anti-sigma factor FlgM [Halalkalibacterium halodurans]|jgi:negative regulator of flagellin synthesis FlgM|uniref:Negative regulator of flagellin synthesis n=2 Tax=Halalkalibacterium halodurans TaxID=86665 RepID=Q9K6V2_HALH5|nr:flagellar biosynthesis anti-sigma factor FlgM [Halalkalibacterium halodurans]MDY7224099.1 flagellar biosynthesis anti-sigma factor FlgM [Halalkalibacterium halodurans]MDY7243384.1 flagellar biosynthesis anti-sigma factor FlgM [Halalkalibacterium halodurans]MED4081934.1 flagellar biosynthesis anti-sigma factor FlgM [Halalkalibacterium halodurans]MED4083685.1 flagellar biosynthesis anti-sigma factor FlgM [Halalkalibacterium halodurans]MED4106413.1 flagellar biosynthesis anti-sigma factor FlgM
MKVNPYTAISQQLYRQQVEKAETVKGKPQKRDQLEISKEAQEMQKGSPIEVEREKKIEEIKQKIEKGEYSVDSRAVADKLYDFWNK